MDHRREAKRRPLRGTGNLIVPPTLKFTVRMLDISSKGVAFVAPANLAIGTAAMFQFPVPAADARSRLFECSLTVAQCSLSGAEQGFRVGAVFEPALSLDARQAVENYVDGADSGPKGPLGGL